jgi:RNA polymerase-binding transcription factor DksA
MQMFGRELTLEQIRGFVKGNEKDSEIRMPSEWVLELIGKAQEEEKLKERLQISPQGDDKIDELEQALEFAKFDTERLKNLVIQLKEKDIPNKPISQSAWKACPTCEQGIGVTPRTINPKAINYCYHCGQKLEWD